MPEFLTTGCMLTCSFGMAPGVFQALEIPGKPVVTGMTVATMVEIIPLENIPDFVMCTSEANPEVIAATAAALGVLTPMPCVPVVVDPWDPPSTLAGYDGLPLATVASTCLCLWGGEIAVDLPSEMVAAVEA